MLLVDHFPFRQIGSPVLCESSHTPGNQVYRVSGVFQNYLKKNQNGRIYPKGIWERVLAPDSDFSKRLARRNVLGHIEHPADGSTKITEASHVITEVWIATPTEIAESNGMVEDGDIMGTYEVLPEAFPAAKLLRGAIQARIDFGGVSSRGNGNVTETMEGLMVNEDYILDTWDVVFNPSVARARPTPRVETVTTESKPITTEPMPKLQESSFVLISGLYGPGKASKEKQFIPIRLISDQTSKNFFWESTSGQGPKLGKFSTFNEALSAMTSHCTETGNVFTPSVLGETEFTGKEEEEGDTCPTTGQKIPPQPPQKATVESITPTTTMDPSQRILNIQSEAIMLAISGANKLKLTEAANVLHKSKTLRAELAQIVEGSKHLSVFAEPISKRLVEFEDELEAEMDAPEAAPAPAAAPTTPAAPAGGEITPDEAVAVLDKATAALRDCGKEDVAAELEGIKDQIEDATGGGDGDIDDASADEEIADIPDYDEDDAPKMESSKAFRKKVLEGYKALRNKYARLAKLSERLLHKHTSLSESSRKGESPALKEAVTRAKRAEVALSEMREDFDTKMIEMASYIWKTKEPKLWEANKEVLSECRTWDAFETLSEKIIKNAPKEMRESTKVVVKPTQLEEDRNQTPPVQPTLSEGVVNAQILMINRARKR